MAPADAGTTLLVGRGATEDGSVLLASSCDGEVKGVIQVMPARGYPPNTEHFLASPNIFSLARELGLWEPGAPFVWNEVWGAPGSR